MKMNNNENAVFLKILMNKIDPCTGEILNISDESLQRIKSIVESNEAICLDKKMLVEDFKNGMDMNALKIKYNLKIRAIKRILRSEGFRYVRKDLNTTMQYIEKHKAYSNAGARYTPEEDEEIVKKYMSGTSVPDLAKTFKRKVGGIRSRLVYHGFATTSFDIEEVWKFANITPTKCNSTNKDYIFNKNNVNMHVLRNQALAFLSKHKKESNENNINEAVSILLHHMYNIILDDWF